MKPFTSLIKQPLLPDEDCRGVLRELLLMDAFWIHRHPCLPFFTLGATNYYDIETNGLQGYLNQAKKYNALLAENFSKLYETLLVFFRDILKADVWLDTHNAMPGFHIFTGHSTFNSPTEAFLNHTRWLTLRNQRQFIGSPVHKDRVHTVIDWQGQQPRPKTRPWRFSFTLPIAIPKAGAGLNLWRNLPDEDVNEERFSQEKPEYHAYAPGELIVHSGDEYHQASGFPLLKGEYRMTLQGHGLRWDKGWSLFW